MVSKYFLNPLFLYLKISSCLTIDRLLSSNISRLQLPPTSTEKILLSEHLVSFDSNHEKFFNERKSSRQILNNELSTLTFTMNINISLNSSCQNKTLLLQQCLSERNQLEKQLRLLNLSMTEREYYFYENRQYSVDRRSYRIVNQSLVSKNTISSRYLNHQRIESSFKSSYLSNDPLQKKVLVEQESFSELRIFKKEIGIQSLIEKLLQEKSLPGKLIAVVGFHFASSTCADLPTLFCACVLASATIYWLLSMFFKHSRKTTSPHSESVEAHPYGEVVGMPLEIVTTGNGKSNNLNEELAQLMKYNQSLQLQLQQGTVEKDSLLSELQQRNAFAEEQLLRLEGNLLNTHRILGKEVDKTSSPLRKKATTPSATPQKNVGSIREEFYVVADKENIEFLRASVADLQTRLAVQVSEAEDYQRRAEGRIQELTEKGAQQALELELALSTISTKESCISDLRVMCDASSDSLTAVKEALALSQEESTRKDSLISGIEDKLKVAESQLEESQTAVAALQEQHLLLLERSQVASDDLEHIDKLLLLINVHRDDENSTFIDVHQLQIAARKVSSKFIGSDVSTRCSQVMKSIFEEVDSLRRAILESSGREQGLKASFASQLEDIEVLRASVADLQTRLAVQVSEAEDYQRRAEGRIQELTEEGAQQALELELALSTTSTKESCISELRVMCDASSDSLTAVKEALALSQEESMQLRSYKDSLISGIEDKLKVADSQLEESQTAVAALQEQHLLLLERSQVASDDLEHIDKLLRLINVHRDDENDTFIDVHQLQIAAGKVSSQFIGSDVSTRCSQVMKSIFEEVDSLRRAIFQSSNREQCLKASFASQLEDIEDLRASVADLQTRLAVQVSEAEDYQRRAEGRIQELTEKGAQQALELELALSTTSTKESSISDLRVMCDASSDSLTAVKEALALSQEESTRKDSLISGIEDKLKVAESQLEESQTAVAALQEQHLLLLERSQVASDDLEHIDELLRLINVHRDDENNTFERNFKSKLTGSDVSTRCFQVMNSMLEEVISLRRAILQSNDREQALKASFASQLVTANQMIGALEQKSNFLKDSHLAEVRDYQGKLQRLEEICRDKEEEHVASQISHDQLSEQVERLQEQIVALSAEKTAHEQHTASLEEDNRVLGQDYKQSLKRIEDLERMNQDLFTTANLKKGTSQRLFELQNEHQKCRVILSEREYSLRNTTKELQVAQAKLIDQATKLKELSDRNVSLEATLNDVEIELKTLLATEKGVLHQRLDLSNNQLAEMHTALESLKKDIQMNSDTFGDIEVQCKGLQKQTESIKMSLNKCFEAHIDTLQSFVEVHDPSFDVSIMTPQKAVEEKRVAALVASFAKSKVSPHPHSTSHSKIDTGCPAVIETPKKSSDVILETISALQAELSKIRSLTSVLQKYMAVQFGE